MTPHHDSNHGAGDSAGPDPLDNLLGLDSDPSLSSEARKRLISRLEDARLEGVLDRLLDADKVAAPSDLPGRVLAGVRSAAKAEVEGALRTSGSPSSGHGRSKRRIRMAFPVAAAAAAALAIWTIRGGWTSPSVDSVPEVAVAEFEGEVSDELLASLSVLEDFEFLTEELDPLEADALFLMGSDDQLLLDLLDAEGDSEIDLLDEDGE